MIERRLLYGLIGRKKTDQLVDIDGVGKNGVYEGIGRAV